MPTAFSTETLVVPSLAWAHGIPHTLPERNVSRSHPSVARQRAARMLVPTASTARRKYVSTSLCRIVWKNNAFPRAKLAR
jgi:hypothetical protein